MKKIGMIMMLLMGIHLYSQESILPSDIETIKNLELSLKEVETQLNVTKAVKIASLATILVNKDFILAPYGRRIER